LQQAFVLIPDYVSASEYKAVIDPSETEASIARSIIAFYLNARELDKLDREVSSISFLTPEMNSVTVCAVCFIRDGIKRIAEWAATIARIPSFALTMRNLKIACGCLRKESVRGV
jgi:hypothetical protein